MKSWKTTAAGWATFIAALATQLNVEWDGDPLTVANWGIVVAALFLALGLTAARDNGVTSKQAGAE